MSKPDKRDFEERYAACFVDFAVKTRHYPRSVRLRPGNQDHKSSLRFTKLLLHIVTGAVGILIGSMMGSFFMRSYRRWPMFIGGGLGFGMAYSNCENSLNSYLLAMDPKACLIKKQP